MTIVDAYWDERVLGVKCAEISLVASDTLDELVKVENGLIASGTQYIVVKAPVAAQECLFGLPRYGHVFIETAFRLVLKRQNYLCPAMVSRFDRNIDVVRVITPEAVERVFAEIAKGIFQTDRVAIDPAFGQEMANRRYVLWIKDLIALGHGLYEVITNGKALGFFVLKRVDEHTMQGILTGAYQEFQDTGIGALIMKKLYDKVWESGCSTYLAAVVSNNFKALRSNMMFGSEIEQLTYHYVRHCQ